MKALATVARILFALPMGIFGLFHLLNAKQMAGIVPSLLGAPLFWVYLTGIVLILACIFIIFKLPYARFVALLLAVELLSFILLIHIPGVFSGDQQTMMMAMPNLLKDTSMLGGALIFAVLLAKGE